MTFSGSAYKCTAQVMPANWLNWALAQCTPHIQCVLAALFIRSVNRCWSRAPTISLLLSPMYFPIPCTLGWSIIYSHTSKKQHTVSCLVVGKASCRIGRVQSALNKVVSLSEIQIHPKNCYFLTNANKVVYWILHECHKISCRRGCFAFSRSTHWHGK